MRSDRPEVSESGQVIIFRPRASVGLPRQIPPRRRGAPRSPVEGLQKFQQSAEEDDTRQGKLVNLLGLVFCLALAVAGLWIAGQFAEMKRVQDCVLSGRSGCIPLSLPQTP